MHDAKACGLQCGLPKRILNLPSLAGHVIGVQAPVVC